MNERFEEMLGVARGMRGRAYSPYSQYQVGAAVLGVDGEVYGGCNVENVSFGLTVCAERVAVGSMVASGCRGVLAVLVLTRDGGSPCGMCRQTLAEFVTEPLEVVVWKVSESGRVERRSLAELLPEHFRSDLGSDGGV